MEKTARFDQRLFVALALSDESRERIRVWQEAALRGSGLRPVPAASLHVTLAFLGGHPPGAVDAIAAAALSAAGGLRAPQLAATRVAEVPPRRPRLWALDLADPGGRAAAIHAAIAGPLAAGGWFDPDERPFWPHMTVARLRPGRPPRAAAVPPSGLLASPEVVLYRSRPGRSGSQYEALARLRLR